MSKSIESNEQASEVLNRAGSIVITLEQLLRAAAFEEPVASSTLSNTLEIVQEIIYDVVWYLSPIESKAEDA